MSPVGSGHHPLSLMLSMPRSLGSPLSYYLCSMLLASSMGEETPFCNTALWNCHSCFWEAIAGTSGKTKNLEVQSAKMELSSGHHRPVVG